MFMHKCVRCGRVAVSLQEIDAGCPCGSKVFIFGRDSSGSATVLTAPDPQKEMQKEAAAPPMPEESKAQSGQARETFEAPSPPAAAMPSVPPSSSPEGKMPESYFARASFSSEDVENIKVLTEGVFVLDVNALSKNPMVLKDEDGIYYVKIPFEQRKPDARQNGNGKG